MPSADRLDWWTIPAIEQATKLGMTNESTTATRRPQKRVEDVHQSRILQSRTWHFLVISNPITVAKFLMHPTVGASCQEVAKFVI